MLGVDDWARRKGQTYGTILVDLERHRVVDQRWLGKSGQSDKWISCLTAAKLPGIRSENDEANAADA